MNLLLLLYAITTCAFTLGKIQSPLAAGSSGTSFQTARLADIQQGFHDDFATFSHPSFPQHGLRIKKIQDFCDSTVNVYSGYLDFTSAGSKVGTDPTVLNLIGSNILLAESTYSFGSSKAGRILQQMM